MRKVILYIASSLDGYIAGADDNLSFLSMVEEKGEDYGYSEFTGTVDTVILGRKTNDWVMDRVSEFPHNGTETYVLTRTPREGYGTIKFYTGNLKELVLRLRQKKGKNIFIDGGAEVVNSLLKYNLIDEFRISVIPVLLGGGIRLFRDNRPQQKLKLVDARTYNKGLVQLHYTSLIP